jgi:hypothetical protein
MAIDVSRLRLSKGVTLRDDVVSALTGTPPGDGDAFKLARLAVKGAVEKALRARGEVCSVKVVKDGVRVLTDSEALHHNAKLHRMGRNKVRRSHRQLDAVDTLNLTAGEQRLYDLEQRRAAASYLALRHAESVADMLRPSRPASAG